MIRCIISGIVQYTMYIAYSNRLRHTIAILLTQHLVPKRTRPTATAFTVPEVHPLPLRIPWTKVRGLGARHHHPVVRSAAPAAKRRVAVPYVIAEFPAADGEELLAGKAG